MALELDIEKAAGSFSLKVSFNSENELLGILGPSGCGKSMTLKCIAGIEKPDRGRIVLDGRVLFDSEKKINLPPQKRQVGYLFQNYALFPSMTVRQNILCGLHAERDKEKKNKEACRIIELLKLQDIVDLLPSQLSGGQAQRTALGRILVNRPKLLMLDEPFSALDAHLRLKLQMELKLLISDYGKSSIMVTHDRDEAFRMCDRIGCMDRGTMLSVKKTHELFNDPGSIHAASMTGCKNIAKAVKRGENELFVPEWKMSFRTGKKIKDGLKAIGIRAHYFSPDCPQNMGKVTICREMEETFEWVSEFRYEGQETGSEALWWRYPKEKRLKEAPEKLGLAEEDILLLYED